MNSRLVKNKAYLDDAENTRKAIEAEFNAGIEILSKIDKPLVTFLGSHITPPESEYYQHAYDLAYKLGEEGFGVLTGGGPGIMAAANEGARDAGAPSLGFKAGLIKNESVENTVFSDKFSFNFLFTRRFFLAIKSEAIIVYPGAFGTLNELFEYLTLIQTDLVDKVPVVCVGKKYWQGLFDWLKSSPLEEGYFSEGEVDMRLMSFADSEDEILNLIKG